VKALVYAGGQAVRQVDTVVPPPAAGEVAVAVLQAGVCGTDLCLVKYERPKAEPGMTLGHEFVGLRLDTGERVIVNPLISCGQCAACRRGQDHLCATRQVIGVHRRGGLAETVNVPVANLVPAGSLSNAQAAMADPVATALHAFRLGPPPQGPVAILGAGAIGLCLLFVLKRLGVEDVTVTDLSPQRLELATRGGATRVGASITQVYDVAYDTVGAESTRADAIAKVRPGGTAILVGLHDANLVASAGPIVGDERTIRGSFGYTRAEFREAIGLLADLDTRWIHTVPFAEAEGAFTALLQGRLHPTQVKLQMRFGNS
jgi:threonine dehydrogenase-like Zn-dependent dehydrogenase